MMVGHALLAFAVVAVVGRRYGWSADRALVAGAVAGAFAAVPDADMLYAFSGLARVDPTAAIGGPAGVFAVTEAFWGASTVAHRSATHSVVVALPAALAFALWTLGGSAHRARGLAARGAAVAVLSGTVAASLATSGLVDALVMSTFAVAGLAVAEVVRQKTDLTTLQTFAVALFAVASHPFGDVFTGDPPRLLYPLAASPITERVALSADPTVHLLAAFGLELAVIWLAILVYARLTGASLGRLVSPRATPAVAYGLTALVFTPPTLDVSYHFVFSIVGMGLLVGGLQLGRPSVARIRRAVGRARFEIVERFRRRRIAPVSGLRRLRPARFDPDRPLSGVLTGATAVTLGWLAYFLAYLAA